MTTLIPALAIRTFRHRDTTDGRMLPALLWRPGPGHRMISSAVLGGGLGARSWVLNAQVAHGYRRRDPEAHLAEIAAAAGAAGPGVGMMTAADILGTRASAHDGGVRALVTAGTGVHGWAATEDAPVRPYRPGTVNILAVLPVALSDAASGTPTDAVCVAARVPEPGGPVEDFAGPRSLWGARLARAVHEATRRSVARERGGGHGAVVELPGNQAATPCG